MMKKIFFGLCILINCLIIPQEPVGLKNVGNACYQNSSLQCLYNIQDLTNFMINMELSDYFVYYNAVGEPTLAKLYTDLVSNLRAGGGPLVPVAFCERAMEKFFKEKFKQEDAGVFVEELLDYLGNRNVKPQHKSDYLYLSPRVYRKTYVNDLFGIFSGLIKKCLQCDEQSITYAVDRILPLAVRTEANDELNSLQQVFDNFIKPVILSDFKCKCGKGATGQSMLFTAPDYFVIQLKRFYRKRDGSFKDDHTIQIPLQFDMSKYYYSTAQQKDFAHYELSGVTIHSGALDGGHYWAYVRTPNGQWFKCDDKNVNQVEESRVKKIETDGYIDYKKATPYILYYQRTTQLPQLNITKEEFSATLKKHGLEAYIEGYLTKKSKAFQVGLDNIVGGINQGLLTESQILDELEAFKVISSGSGPEPLPALQESLKKLEISLEALNRQLSA